MTSFSILCPYQIKEDKYDNEAWLLNFQFLQKSKSAIFLTNKSVWLVLET